MSSADLGSRLAAESSSTRPGACRIPLSVASSSLHSRSPETFDVRDLELTPQQIQASQTLYEEIVG